MFNLFSVLLRLASALTTLDLETRAFPYFNSLSCSKALHLIVILRLRKQNQAALQGSYSQSQVICAALPSRSMGLWKTVLGVF